MPRTLALWTAFTTAGAMLALVMLLAAVVHHKDTVLVAPGERIGVPIEASERGVWAYHCHVLTHAEGPDGMFGMVTALVVEEE
jgi:FtsP/CotA-like multicopper oxidase with cupredoxin domain